MTPLIGRDSDLARVARLLFGPEPAPILTITGPSGIGKTRLVGEIVERARRDGRELVTLSAATGQDGPASAKGSAGPYVIDEADSGVTRAREAAGAVLRRHPHAPLLVTALAPLGLPGERVHRLGRLAAATHGVALFNAALTQHGSVSSDPQPVAGLCAELGGLPLAIRAAAELAEAAPPGYLLQRLAVARLLDVLGDAAPAGERTLREAVERTCAELAEADRELLARLSALPASFSMGAAVAVAGRSEGATLSGMSRLTSAGVAFRLGWDEVGPRFGVPRAVRELAQEWLPDADAVRAARTRHYHAVANVARQRYLDGGEDVALATLERDCGALNESADQLAVAGDLGGALEVAVTAAVAPLSLWYDHHAAPSLARRLHLAGTSASPALRVRARLLAARLAVEHAADLPVRHGRLTQGLLDAVAASRECHDDELQAVGIGYAIEGLLDAGETAACRRLIGQSQRLELDGMALGQLLGWSAVVLAALGESSAARATMERGLEQAGAERPSRSLLAACARFAELAPDPGGPLDADRLLITARVLRDRHLEVRILTQLARAALAQGHDATALRRAREALETVQEAGGVRVGAACAGALLVLAECAAARNAVLDAARLYHALRGLAPRALAAAEGLGARDAQHAELTALLGAGHAKASRDVACWTLADAVREALALAERLGSPADGRERPRDVALDPCPADPPEAEEPAAHAEGESCPDRRLTERERDVLAHIARGATNKVIGDALGISPKTVMHHSVAIYRKLGAHSRAEAAVLAIQQGLVPARG